jgi:hypothetical protein
MFRLTRTRRGPLRPFISLALIKRHNSFKSDLHRPSHWLVTQMTLEINAGTQISGNANSSVLIQPKSGFNPDVLR